MAALKKVVKKKKKVSHMKTERVDVKFHLQPRTGRLQIILTVPDEISAILVRRLAKRLNG